MQVPAPPPGLAPPIDPIIAAGQLQLGEDGPMGALGVNLGDYFDPDAPLERRVTRVERAITAIQNDLKTLAPPIKRLITVERDIQELVAQLADFVAEPPATPPPAMQPVQASYTAPISSPPMNMGGVISPNAPVLSSTHSGNVISGGKQAAGSATINRLRTGEHKDKTRIVLDASGPTSYRYDLDNSENILVIELPNASWSGKQQETIRKSPLVASYNVYPASGGGSRVVIQLKRSTSIKYEIAIRPNGNKNYRIVLDLKK